VKVCLFKYDLCEEEMNINILFYLIDETTNAALITEIEQSSFI
jgi:hypothetical protein